MFSAASRFLLVFLLSAAVGSWAAEASARAAPSRPAASKAASPSPSTVPPSSTASISGKRFGGTEYVRVTDVAARLGLNLTWRERGKKLTLTAPGVRAEMENDSRDMQVNGLRVFLGDPVLDSAAQLYISRVDFERCLTPLLRPGLGVPPLREPKVVVLDPGHGGKDTGTSLNEKVYALDVAKRAKKSLEAAGYKVFLTRETDKYIELAERAAIAKARRADLFVSIHFNALPNDRKTSGVEVFTFAPKSQHAAEWWSLLRKDDPHLETTDMPINRYDHWNVVLGQAMQRRFVSDLKAFDRGKKLAHWGVLRGLDCPGVLVECGFLTSETEARKIATPAYRQQIAEALAGGVRDYVTAARGAKPAAPALVATTGGRAQPGAR